MGTITLPMTPGQFTAPDEASAAPISPPMRAWVDEEGRPNHQVMRFHPMAPMRAANTTTRPCVPVGVAIMPLPTVTATLVETSAPTTLRAAAIPRATKGDSALVVMETATAFAAS